MKTVCNIAVTVFREKARDKLFYSIIGFGTVILFSSLIINEMVVGERLKVVKDFGLATLLLLGVFSAAFIGVGSISKEIVSKTHYIVMPKPISRVQYIIGNYIGIISIIIVNMIILMIFIWLLLLLMKENWLLNLLRSGYMIFLELMILSACSIMISTIMNTVPGMFTLFMLFAAGHSTEKALSLVTNSPNSSIITQKAVYFLYYIVPNFENFNIKAEMVYNMQLPLGRYIYATFYGLAFTSIIITIAVLLFSRKEV